MVEKTGHVKTQHSHPQQQHLHQRQSSQRQPSQHQHQLSQHQHLSRKIFTINTAVLIASLIALLSLLMPASGALRAEEKPEKAMPVNLSHLDFLRDTVTTPEGKKLSIWAIYAEPVTPGDIHGPYRRLGDDDEGLSCVDDVARAALVYLNEFRQSGNPDSLIKAREALDFVTYMQTDSGLFYNFIFSDGRINREGQTSRASVDFWTVRAFWALAEGYRTFRTIDPAYGAVLKSRTNLIISALKEDHSHSCTVSKSSTAEDGQKRSRLQWLVGKGTDQTSVALLALSTLYETDGSDEIKVLMERYAEALLASQGSSPEEFPYCSFPSWLPAPNVWHAWGSRQMMSLAKAGRLLRQKKWIEAAEQEAQQWIMRLLGAEGLIFAIGPLPITAPAQPYGNEVLTCGLIELYRATGKEQYATMAGLMASWFFGNNSSSRPVYDAQTGRVFDGVDGRKLNTNSGAEATVSGLLALLELKETPAALPWLSSRLCSSSSYSIAEAETGKILSGDVEVTSGKDGSEGMFSGKGSMALKGKSRLALDLHVDAAGLYLPVICYAFEGKGIGTLKLHVDGKKECWQIQSSEKDRLLLFRLPPFSLNKGTHRLVIELCKCEGPIIASVDGVMLEKPLWRSSYRTEKRRSLTILKNITAKDITARPECKLSRGADSGLITIYDRYGKTVESGALKGSQSTSDSSTTPNVTVPPFGSVFIEEGIIEEGINGDRLQY
ncbi:MAG: hypothetical protein AB9903_03020 [Vulcanimicrobiota bacterium]